MGPTHTHTRRQVLPVAGAPGAPRLGSSCPAGTQLGTHELQVKVSSAVLRTISKAETSGHMPPPGVHTCSQVGDSSTRIATYVILALS